MIKQTENRPLFVQFEYNEDGLRTKKTVTVGNSTTVTEYTLHGKNVVHLTQGNNALHFYYDAQDKPAIVIFNGTAYGYLYNLQGDVIALVDGTGTKVVEYTYDAWGKPTGKTGTMASTLGTVQPFKYRGYVFDEETGLYYLKCRYYNPNKNRLINYDPCIKGNIYWYCTNNPINMIDPTGKTPIIAFIGLLLICTVALAGCSSQDNTPRKDLVDAPDLDIENDLFFLYNCYGNAIKKRIAANPTGYIPGDSTQKTFEGVIKDIGEAYVRRLDSPYDSIREDEYLVAMRCGPRDFHFIRLTENGWYNKSGRKEGLYVDETVVFSPIWYCMYIEDNRTQVDYSLHYDDDPYGTIFFAITEGWDN